MSLLEVPQRLSDRGIRVLASVGAEGGEAGRCWLGREEAGAEERERDESGKIEDRDDKVEAR